MSAIINENVAYLVSENYNYYLVTSYEVEVCYFCEGFQMYNIADVRHCTSVSVIILSAKWRPALADRKYFLFIVCKQSKVNLVYKFVATAGF